MYEQLISIKGVGPKTANLVLGVAFGVPAICVDVHVHRICNRFGLIKTKTPEQTEAALQKLLDKKYWTEWNSLVVTWGQQVCTPVSPRCSTCALANLCKRVGVMRAR
jgi:endonuclease-3